MSNNFEIETNEYLQQCDSKDVISFDNQKWVDIKKLKSIIYYSFSNTGIDSVIANIIKNSDLKDKKRINSWFRSGEECEILRADSKGWRKGKIKIKVFLEFIPDELEENKSPLDDVRQEIDRGDR